PNRISDGDWQVGESHRVACTVVVDRGPLCGRARKYRSTSPTSANARGASGAACLLKGALMSNKNIPSSSRFSVDAWAVFTALLLAAIVRFGIVKHVPW